MAKITQLNTLAVSALALLTERSMHPYEMQQVMILRTEDRIVKITPGSLYHTVNRLEELGLVRSTGTTREGNRPERTTYEITDEGLAAFTGRVAEIVSRPVNEFPEFPMGLAQSHHLPLDVVVELLRKRLALLRADLIVLTASIDAMQERSLPARLWMDKRYLREAVKAEMSALTALIDDLNSGVIPWGETTMPQRDLPTT